mgnify:CR=1 FL=1
MQLVLGEGLAGLGAARAAGQGRALKLETVPGVIGLAINAKSGLLTDVRLRRALLLSRGDWSVLVTRPLSAGLLLAAVLLLVIVLLPSVSKKREDVFVED